MEIIESSNYNISLNNIYYKDYRSPAKNCNNTENVLHFVTPLYNTADVKMVFGTSKQFMQLLYIGFFYDINDHGGPKQLASQKPLFPETPLINRKRYKENATSSRTLTTFMKRSNNESLQHIESRIEVKRLTSIIIRFTCYRTINRFIVITRPRSVMSSSEILPTRPPCWRQHLFQHGNLHRNIFVQLQGIACCYYLAFIYYIFPRPYMILDP